MEDETIETTHSKTTENLDKLTMELLLNKNHYSKYLQHTDTKRFDEFKLFKSKLRKHSIDIIDITSELIENPKKIINKDIEELFEAYTKSIIRYLEIKETDLSISFTSSEKDDDDVLFGNMNDATEPLIELEEEPKKSYWGKERVIKSKNISSIDMYLFKPLKK